MAPLNCLSCHHCLHSCLGGGQEPGGGYQKTKSKIEHFAGSLRNVFREGVYCRANPFNQSPLPLTYCKLPFADKTWTLDKNKDNGREQQEGVLKDKKFRWSPGKKRPSGRGRFKLRQAPESRQLSLLGQKNGCGPLAETPQTGMETTKTTTQFRRAHRNGDR